MIKIKRVYDEVSKDDGFRILVDRLWPRGVSKEKVKIDLWLKEIAPSDGLRKWFSHDPEKWQDFQKKYRTELRLKSKLIEKVKELEKSERIVTLVYSAKDKEHNNAVALSKIL